MTDPTGDPTGADPRMAAARDLADGHYTWGEEWGTHRRGIMSGPFSTAAEAAADLDRARQEYQDRARSLGTRLRAWGLCCVPADLIARHPADTATNGAE